MCVSSPGRACVVRESWSSVYMRSARLVELTLFHHVAKYISLQTRENEI